jgi:hypothetical protein
MVGVSPEDAYVVDVFRVFGGERHEYVLAGDADHDGAIETGLALSPFGDTWLPPGAKATLPTVESVPGDAQGRHIAYAFIRDVRQAGPSGDWTATFTSRMKPEGSVRVHGLAQPGTTLYLGDAPSIRRAGEDDGKVDAFTMPVLVERRAVVRSPIFVGDDPH